MRRMIFALVFGIGLDLVAPSASAQSFNENPRVLPPSAKPYGHSYGDWTAEWWQWALSAPAPVNPLVDPTGANCAQGQSGHVWFLAGTLGGDAVRSCTVAVGTALFFPIVNTFLADEGTVDEMRVAAADFVDSVVTMSVSIDGQPVESPGGYRSISPVFSITLPVQNIFGAPEGTYSPAVSDGYWLMLAPLPPGSHIIHFSAATSNGFSLDVIYYLTVQAGA